MLLRRRDDLAMVMRELGGELFATRGNVDNWFNQDYHAAEFETVLDWAKATSKALEMKKHPNQIVVNPLTGQWYLVLEWSPEGSAVNKIEITEEMRKVKAQMEFEWELL
jgi:hypothetical protein